MKARKPCNAFKFMHNLKSVENGEEFETIYPLELQIGKVNKVKHEARFLDVNIKIRDEELQTGLFNKKDLSSYSSYRIFKSCQSM